MFDFALLISELLCRFTLYHLSLLLVELAETHLGYSTNVSDRGSNLGLAHKTVLAC